MGQAFWLAEGSLGDSSRILSPGMDSEADPSHPGPRPPHWRLCGLLRSKQSFLPSPSPKILFLACIHSEIFRVQSPLKAAISFNLPIKL